MPKKPVMKVGNISAIDMIVSLFMIMFMLFPRMELKASIVPDRMLE